MLQKYQSPIRLLAYCDLTTELLITAPNKAKKIIQAEFASSEDGYITIDQYTYNKQDFIDELRPFNLVERWQMHQYIWEQKDILNYLEHARIAKKAYEVPDNGQLTAFSEYFGHAFLHATRQLIANNDLQGLGKFMNQDIYIASEDLEDAYQAVHQYLNEQYRVFKNLNTDNYLTRKNQIGHWFNQDWWPIFQYLPEVLDHHIDNFVRVITDFLVEIQYIDKVKSIFLAYNLKQIDTMSIDLYDLCQDNYDILTDASNNNREEKQKRGWQFYGMYVFIFFALIKAIATCNKEDEKTINWQENEPTLQQLKESIKLDSILLQRLTTDSILYDPE